MLSQHKIQHSFHRALASYNDSALVQKDNAENLFNHLVNAGIHTAPNRVFEFGCGTGFLTHHLTERLTIKQLYTNDLVEECREYLPLSGHDFIAGDVDNIDIPNQCDLICSASCVQWSRDLSGLLRRLTMALNDHGFLAISSFGQGHFKQLSILKTQRNLEAKEQLNYWPEQKWQQQLGADYDLILTSTEETSLWFDSVKELLLHLRLTGVNGNAGQSWTQQSLSQFESDYRDNFESKGKLPLSYKTVYIIAQKKPL